MLPFFLLDAMKIINVMAYRSEQKKVRYVDKSENMSYPVLEMDRSSYVPKINTSELVHRRKLSLMT